MPRLALGMEAWLELIALYSPSMTNTSREEMKKSVNLAYSCWCFSSWHCSSWCWPWQRVPGSSSLEANEVMQQCSSEHRVCTLRGRGWENKNASSGVYFQRKSSFRFAVGGACNAPSLQRYQSRLELQHSVWLLHWEKTLFLQWKLLFLLCL